MTLQGTFTAIVTPFDTTGQVDWPRLRRLVEIQIEAGVDGIVPVGTTGESPSLSYEEHMKVIQTTIEAANGRLTVIAGTGANATSEALELTRQALKAGADATLQVTPYYNKPSQEGLYRHFSAVTDLGLPVVLYNVPGRAGCEIAVDTIVRLSKHPHIAAVKEAGGSVDRVSAIRSACDIAILSGDDALAHPMIAVGAQGVISVASNIIPGPIVELIRAALAGDAARARELHLQYWPLFHALFLDTNPIPIKAAMAMTGLIEEVYRLPLCAASNEVKSALRATLTQLNLL